MKNNLKIILLFLVIASVLITMGCVKGELITIKGTIMKVAYNRVLISQTSELKPQDFNKSIEQLAKKRALDLIWVDTSNLKRSFETGNQVKVWLKGDIKESYPAQAEAKKIKIIDKSPPQAEEEKQGQALKYKIFKELPDDLKEPIGYIKELRGFGIVNRNEKETIIYIGSGKQSTGGYGISVESVRKLKDITRIEVSETTPRPDENVTQVITYPYIVIKVFEAVGNIEVVNDQGDKFENINDESLEADYYEKEIDNSSK